MKIVFLSYLHGFGGAEKQNVMLANAMAERGHEVHLVSISADNNCYPLDERVRYRFLPDRKTNALRFVTRYQDIHRTLLELQPDLTVNFWFQSAYLCAAMSRKITGKLIYSERGDPGDREYSGALGLIRRLSLPRIDGFVFQSRGAQHYFDRTVQERSTVIPNPVFVKAGDFPPVSSRRKTIVTVGRLHPQKNQALLIRAFARIAGDFPEYTLEIYGDGELRQSLQRQIDALGLSDRVFLKGTSARIHELIRDAALFVLSSDYEGMPNTLLEAMSLGIPCISTDCRPGGAREIIEDGEDGLIVPCEDEESLAGAMAALLSDPEKAAAFSREAILRCARFAPNAIYDDWERFFLSLLDY